MKIDCIGFTERHREAVLPLGLPVILSNAVAAKALSELLGGYGDATVDTAMII